MVATLSSWCARVVFSFMSLAFTAAAVHGYSVGGSIATLVTGVAIGAGFGSAAILAVVVEGVRRDVELLKAVVE